MTLAGRPGAPTPQVLVPEPTTDLTADEDDDAVIVPAPSLDYLGHVHTGSPQRRRPAGGSIQYQRTLIPILLVGGLCFGAIAAAHFVLPEDTPLAVMPTPYAVAMCVLGGIAVVGAALLMVQVRAALQAKLRARQAN